MSQCREIAVENGWDIFSLQVEVQCFTAADAGSTYNKYGKSDQCVDGKGGTWANSVYQIHNGDDKGKYLKRKQNFYLACPMSRN